MAPKKKGKNELTKIEDVKMDKISIFFRRSILKNILKILTMEHAGFRTFKSVKNINRLFTNLDLRKYQNNSELMTYIWCICFISKQWLAGVTSPEVIVEMAKNQEDFPPLGADILSNVMDDRNYVTAPEAKAIFDLISEALQYGFITAMKEEYITLLDDINLDEPGAFKKLTERLFMISKSLMDIRHNTNMISNKIEFNTADMDSLKEAFSLTIDSLKEAGALLKTGIRRLNTLLSPAYMNGRLYVYCGTPGAGKSIMLLKSALDIRKYNPGFKTKTPGMKPCALYISMENTFTETIERIWNMTFDDPVTDYTKEEAVLMICNELGIKLPSKNESNDQIKKPAELDLLGQIMEHEKSVSEDTPNIEIAIQYYPYKSINTDDLYTIIQDLHDDNLEVCALIFDYIKRIEPSIPVHDNAKLELDRIINELKALAVILDIPVITAHQLNRTAIGVMDQAAKTGKTDIGKLAGRDHLGDSIDILQVCDWMAVINSEYKPGTDDKYMTINVLKRRRIDASEAEFAKYTYLAHPFAKNNGLRLLDDINQDKVLSLQSLASDIDIVGLNKERTNAVPRLQTLKAEDFDENF